MDTGETKDRTLRGAFLRFREEIEATCERLDREAATFEFGLDGVCAEASAKLREALERCPDPGDYRVAVVGRFKVGKSSFVNALLRDRLAGVNASPETAAVTTFRYGPALAARIRIIDPATWSALKAAWHEDPDNPDSRRFAQWMRFAGKETDGESFDLERLEREHLSLADGTVLITPPGGARTAEERKRVRASFSRQVKEYTTATRPHHCLVEAIEIETPSELLETGVMLIDTPGLDDAERYRVELTQDALGDVDAVIFLTKSGAAYGQSEKDFLLSLLRRGTVSQLMVVVTQVDEMLAKAAMDAEDEGEDPVDTAKLVEGERERIRGLLTDTFDEVARDVSPDAVARYREQIDALDLTFVSVKNENDRLANRAVVHPLAEDDPGGLAAARDRLDRILSTESRLSEAIRTLESAVRSTVVTIRDRSESRTAALREERDEEAAQEALKRFRAALEDARSRFDAATARDVEAFSKGLNALVRGQRTCAEVVGLAADHVLKDYEAEDLGRHWRTRRNGGWGTMRDLQVRVANRIFPRIQKELQDAIAPFEAFLDAFDHHARQLSAEAEEISAASGQAVAIDLKAVLDDYSVARLEMLQDLLELENRRIMTLLDDFVGADVEHRIVDARSQIAGILGTGTVKRQNEALAAFYREVGEILRHRVEAHVAERFGEWNAFLARFAGELPVECQRRINAEFDRAAEDLRIAQRMRLDDMRERAAANLGRLSDEVGVIESALAGLAASRTRALPPADGAARPAAEADDAHARRPFADAGVELDAIVDLAVDLKERHRLEQHARGWSFERILGQWPHGAEACWLIDPYLEKRHQRRNLKEFILALAKTARPRTVLVLTRAKDRSEASDFFQTLDREAYELTGIKIDVAFGDDLHDRSIAFDNGVLFKLGRGLDIFEPARGLASREPRLRRVRSCEIDVFAPAGLEHHPT